MGTVYLDQLVKSSSYSHFYALSCRLKPSSHDEINIITSASLLYACTFMVLLIFVFISRRLIYGEIKISMHIKHKFFRFACAISGRFTRTYFVRLCFSYFIVYINIKLKQYKIKNRTSGTGVVRKKFAVLLLMILLNNVLNRSAFLGLT